MKSLTIYDIKRLTVETSPYFFETKTLKFFGQTMKSFKVYKQVNGKYYIIAPIVNKNGMTTNFTERMFNPINNKLEHITSDNKPDYQRIARLR